MSGPTYSDKPGTNGRPPVLAVARQYLGLGLSVIPILPDGSKSPAVPEWTSKQSERATDAELDTWFKNGRNGPAIVGGKVSGNLYIYDFETTAIFNEWAALVTEENANALDNLPMVRTPEPGVHLYCTLSHEPPGNEKLAEWWTPVKQKHILAEPARLAAGGKPKKWTAIETRGTAGYVLAVGCPEACHETRRLYEFVAPTWFDGGIREPIADEVFELFNRCARVLSRVVESEPEEQQAGGKFRGKATGGNDDWFKAAADGYNLNASWGEILVGWTVAKKDDKGKRYWRRPGKDHGWSATTGHEGRDILTVFSSNADPFQEKKTYSKFGAYALLNHGGDFLAAAKALAGDKAPGGTGRQQQDDPPKRRPVERFKFTELCEKYPKLRPPVLDGLVRAGEVVNIVSHSKIGKSWLAYGLILSVVTGRSLFDRFEAPFGRMLLIDNELHKETLSHRLRAVADAMKIPLSEIEGKLDVWSLRGNLRDIFEIEEELCDVKPGQYAGILFDAKYRMTPSGVSENENATETQFYNQLDYYAEMTGAALFNIHHSTKGAQDSKRVTDVGSGASAQSRAADCHLILREHEEPDVVVLEARVRSFAPIDPLPLKWDFPLWLPADGIDPSKLRGRTTEQERKQRERDHDGYQKILDGLKNGPQTRRQLRSLTGFGADRLNRLLAGLMAENKITSHKKAWVAGNETELFKLADDGPNEAAF